MPIINITKKEHIKEYNKHIKDIIDNLESVKDIYSISIIIVVYNGVFWQKRGRTQIFDTLKLL